MEKTLNYEKRLAEIALINLGELSDEEVLHFLAERKQLQELQDDYLKLKQEQEQLARIEEERATVNKELARLNKLISPDKPDDELIHLIEERKVWEAKLAALEQSGQGVSTSEEETKNDTVPAVASPVTEVVSEPLPVREVPVEEQPESEVSQTAESMVENIIDKDFGSEKVVDLSLPESSEFYPYIEEIRRSEDSIGKILEGLPAHVKRDKLFMLEVAKIDSAYAMHYADQNTLKKDPDFNLKIASIKNNRGSGSALAEMLPEARTAQVVMAAIKADYRNVRFLLPQMEGYNEMLTRAKKGALQKVKDLKEGADIAFLIPKILQKDKDFMKQVEAIVPKIE